MSRMKIACPKCDDGIVVITYEETPEVPQTRYSPYEPPYAEVLDVVYKDCRCEVEPEDCDEAMMEKLAEYDRDMDHMRELGRHLDEYWDD